MTVYEQVVKKLGTQTALARLCGVSPQAAGKWRRDGFPPKQCRTIEAATGIPASALNPEVFGPVKR